VYIGGSREDKYRTLAKTDVQSTKWCELQPTSPYYLFVPQATDYSTEYETDWAITDIFQTGSVGIVTGRDKLALHWTADELRETVANFLSLSVDEAREKYQLRKDSEDWKIHLAQTDLRNHPDADQHIVPIDYRTYDTRWTYYTGKSSGFHGRPRFEVMRHLLEENLGICVCRVVTSPAWHHIMVTDKIVDKCYISNRGSESSYVFPLYLYPNSEELGFSTERSLNFKPAFLTALAETLESPQTEPFNLPDGVSPEDILGYIYAILYSPTYRERYYEFLKYDFPRIPMPQDIEQFRLLAALGQRLMHSHLLKDGSRPGGTSTEGRGAVLHRFEGEGDGIVAQVRYVDGQVWINPTQYFTDVPVEVWAYEVGAYQVCEKWLKDRRKTVLSHAEVRQYRAILVAVAETLRMMEEIDKVDSRRFSSLL